MKRFEVLRTLGDGGFGTVFECIDKDNGEHVAIKKIKQRFNSFDECLQLKEVKSLRKIKHTNVVKLLQIFREDGVLYLVFELMGETLLKTINRYASKGTGFSVDEVRNVMRQIFTGLAFIHKQGFFHRDMKPDNVMWGDNGVIKISDFGLAREIRSRPPYTEYISTRWYRAPEMVLRSMYYNSPVDIWAAGAIMAELFTGKVLFQGNSETDQLFKIIHVLGTPNLSQWPEAAKLATKMNIRFPQATAVPLETLMPNAPPSAIQLLNDIFKYDPSKRPSATQCLNHPFFTEDGTASVTETDVAAMSNLSQTTATANALPVIESPIAKKSGHNSSLHINASDCMAAVHVAPSKTLGPYPHRSIGGFGLPLPTNPREGTVEKSLERDIYDILND